MTSNLTLQLRVELNVYGLAALLWDRLRMDFTEGEAVDVIKRGAHVKLTKAHMVTLIRERAMAAGPGSVDCGPTTSYPDADVEFENALYALVARTLGLDVPGKW